MTKRLNVDLPDDVFSAFKNNVEHRGETLASAVRQMVADYIGPPPLEDGERLNESTPEEVAAATAAAIADEEEREARRLAALGGVPLPEEDIARDIPGDRVGPEIEMPQVDPGEPEDKTLTAEEFAESVGWDGLDTEERMEAAAEFQREQEPSPGNEPPPPGAEVDPWAEMRGRKPCGCQAGTPNRTIGDRSWCLSCGMRL